MLLADIAAESIIVIENDRVTPILFPPVAVILKLYVVSDATALAVPVIAPVLVFKPTPPGNDPVANE